MDKLEQYGMQCRVRRLIEDSIRHHASPAVFGEWMSVWHEEALDDEYARTVYNDKHYKL